MAELRAEIKACGYTLRIYRRPIVWRRHGEGPNFGEIQGRANSARKTITVTTYGRVSRRAFLHILAHELRHAQHATTGLFSDYYRDELDTAAMYVTGEVKRLPFNFKMPCLWNAYFAEVDCDNFGCKWLADRGYQPANKQMYRYEDTAAYWLVKELNKVGIK